MLANLTVDIVSDVACPWCAIGYAQLERAAAAMADRAEISVRWHPFELAPDTPPEGRLLTDYMRERYGVQPGQGGGARQRIIDLGRELGTAFNYSDASRMYNTRRAHVLLAWAGEAGGQTTLSLALFRAFFADQANVYDTEVLLAAVEAAGLDRKAATAALDDQRYAAQVEAEEAHWRDRNIDGVPAFIINGKYMIPGAQDADTFVRYLDRVIEKETLAA